MILTCVRTASFQIWLHHISWCFSVWHISILLPWWINVYYIRVRMECAYVRQYIFILIHWSILFICKYILSFIRLIRLKRDEIKRRRIRTRRRKQWWRTGRLCSLLHYLHGVDKRRRRFLYNTGLISVFVYFWRCLFIFHCSIRLCIACLSLLFCHWVADFKWNFSTKITSR